MTRPNSALVLRRASETAPGESVRVTLHEGELRCDVREIMKGHGTDDH